MTKYGGPIRSDLNAAHRKPAGRPYDNLRAIEARAHAGAYKTGNHTDNRRMTIEDIMDETGLTWGAVVQRLQHAGIKSITHTRPGYPGLYDVPPHILRPSRKPPRDDSMEDIEALAAAGVDLEEAARRLGYGGVRASQNLQRLLYRRDRRDLLDRLRANRKGTP